MTLVRVPEHIHSHSDRHRTAHQETERGWIRHLQTTYAAPQAACVAQEWRLGCVSTAHYLCVSLDTKRHTTWGVPGAQQSRFCSYQAAIIMSKSDAQWRESARSQRVLRFMRTHFGRSRPWACAGRARRHIALGRVLPAEVGLSTAGPGSCIRRT